MSLKRSTYGLPPPGAAANWTLLIASLSGPSIVSSGDDPLEPGSRSPMNVYAVPPSGAPHAAIRVASNPACAASAPGLPRFNL